MTGCARGGHATEGSRSIKGALTINACSPPSATRALSHCPAYPILSRPNSSYFIDFRSHMKMLCLSISVRHHDRSSAPSVSPLMCVCDSHYRLPLSNQF
ncbi:uncharacterized protein SCHCODRAFT_02618556, partial [Schizophyllum commune H4-8]|uniref:uncharacterized protein n=1 Tax=Schizophyllum commune (strain H4-8 / FGSC 9210) TaxID=578458 RepID=UPI00215FEADF